MEGPAHTMLGTRFVCTQSKQGSWKHGWNFQTKHHALSRPLLRGCLQFFFVIHLKKSGTWLNRMLQWLTMIMQVCFFVKPRIKLTGLKKKIQLPVRHDWYKCLIQGYINYLTYYTPLTHFHCIISVHWIAQNKVKGCRIGNKQPTTACVCTILYSKYVPFKH